MKPLFLIAVFSVIQMSNLAHAQWQSQQSGAAADFRGLSVVNVNVVWASGTHGTVARTIDGGATWQAATVSGAETLDFRDIEAIDENTAYVLSAGTGELSRIYKTIDGGAHWTLRYTNPNPQGFFDAMAFWDANHGIALSDPVGGRFVLITTSNGGITWEEIPSESIPPALDGEAAFAASGTCLVVQGSSNVWFGTGGGARARVFRSTDRGRTWRVAMIPIAAGNSSSGVFSLAFRDRKHGVAVGGDYQKPAEGRDNVAVTKDGGKTWRRIKGKLPGGFRSSVAYIPMSKSRLVTVGPSGSDYSADGGDDWVNIGKEGYNTIGFTPNVSIGWAVGPKGRIARYNPMEC